VGKCSRLGESHYSPEHRIQDAQHIGHLSRGERTPIQSQKWGGTGERGRKGQKEERPEKQIRKKKKKKEGKREDGGGGRHSPEGGVLWERGLVKKKLCRLS